MKGKHRINVWSLILLLTALAVLGIIGNRAWQGTFKTFATPEEAVYGYEGGSNNIEFLSVMEEKGLGLVFYIKENTVCRIKIQKKNNKWKVVTNESLFQNQKMDKVKNYWISAGTVDGKYYVWINADNSSANITDPYDSCNSVFMKNVSNLEKYLDYDWFAVFDEVPGNYSIVVDGETVQMT